MSLQEVGGACEGFSGADLSALLADAQLEAVHEVLARPGGADEVRAQACDLQLCSLNVATCTVYVYLGMMSGGFLAMLTLFVSCINAWRPSEPSAFVAFCWGICSRIYEATLRDPHTHCLPSNGFKLR